MPAGLEVFDAAGGLSYSSEVGGCQAIGFQLFTTAADYWASGFVPVADMGSKTLWVFVTSGYRQNQDQFHLIYDIVPGGFNWSVWGSRIERALIWGIR